MKAKTKSLNETPSLFYVLLILLFYPPFFRGLFFSKELMPTHIFTAITFVIYYFSTRKFEESHKYSWLEIGFFMLIGSYMVSTLMAANLNLSIQETLKYIDYLLIILLSKRMISTQEKLKVALTTLVAAGVIVVFIGVGSALETFTYNGAFVGGMISSTFQYHNAFGIYCLAILFLADMLFADYEGKIKYFMGVSTFILFFGLILSYSRGAWVFLPVSGLIYYLLVSTKYKISFMSGILGNLLGILVTIKPFTAATEGASKGIGWLWFVAGIIISLATSLFIERLLYKANLKEKIYNLFIPIFALAIPAIGLALKDKLLIFLPENLAQRIGSISLGTETVTERTVFYQDALHMIKDHPIFGAGGGGWSTLYKMYQTYAYNSTQAHNYYMQLWIEIGTVGIIIFAGLLLAYLYYSFKAYKGCEEPSSKGMLAAMFTAVITILMHSAMDFDLALSALAIIMWSMIGMQLGVSTVEKEVNIKIGSKVSYIAVGLTIILLVVASMNHMASNAVYRGIAYVQNNDIQTGKEQFEKASKLNSFDASVFADYANIVNGIAAQTNNQEQRQESIEIMDKAVALGQYDIKILSNASKFYFRNLEIEKGLETINKLEKYQPLNSSTYETKSSALLTLANAYIVSDQKDKAIPYLKEIVEMENKINQLNEEIKNNVEMNNMVRFVEIMPKTKENIDKAKEILDGLK